MKSRAKKAGGRSFGNDLYRVEFEHDPCTGRVPLFGAKYGFHLEGVVDCPEFLVHFPTLERLAEKFGLELVFKKSFMDYYLQCKEEGRSLLGKMQALETYPPFHDSPLLSKDLDDYEHVQQYMQRSTGHRKNKERERESSHWRGVERELVKDGNESMICGAVQALERVVGAVCGSAEERRKG
uniref:mRNA (guanine-N(7))-methyltransferase n=1 Tax=Timema douglasi TaxID=61478 RepID=A0A7R8W1I5_TIMDO|nr:unnamed protein product [Timema douglasi]